MWLNGRGGSKPSEGTMKRIVHLTETFFYNPGEDKYFCDKCYEMWYIDYIFDDTSIERDSTIYLCFKCQSEGK